MKKPTNNIDLLFQSHFDTHEVPVSDPNHLWKKINSQKGSKSRGLVLILALFLSVSGWLTYTQLNLSDTNQDYSTTTQSNSSSYNTPPQETSGIATIDREENDERATISTASSKNALSSLTSSDNSIASQELYNKSRVNQTVAYINKVSSKETKTSISEAGFQAGGGGSADKYYITKTEEKSASTKISTPALIDNQEIKITASANHAISNYQLDNLNKIDALSPSALSQSSSYKIPLPSNKMMKKCVVGQSNFQPYIDVYGSLSAPLESIGLTASALDQTQHLANWEERFQPLTSISAGLAFGNEWNNGIGASIGIEYQRMESQYKTTQTITERTTIFDPMAFFFIDDNDEIVWVGDSVVSVTTFDRTVAHANTTTLINIPLLVSYNLVDRNQWKVKASAGGVLNLSLRYRGRYLQPNQALIVIDETNQDGIVAPQIGIGIEAGLDIGYFIAPHWEVYASPRYRFNQSSYWEADTAISLSRDYLGLRTGVRYHF